MKKSANCKNSWVRQKESKVISQRLAKSMSVDFLENLLRRPKTKIIMPAGL